MHKFETFLQSRVEKNTQPAAGQRNSSFFANDPFLQCLLLKWMRTVEIPYLCVLKIGLVKYICVVVNLELDRQKE